LAKKGAIVKSVLLRRCSVHDSWTKIFPPTEIKHSTPIIIGKEAIVLVTSLNDDTVLLDEWKIADDNFCFFQTNFCLGGARCDCSHSIGGDNHYVLLRLYYGNDEAKLTKYNIKRKVGDFRELLIWKEDKSVPRGEGQNVTMMKDPYSADAYYVDLVDNEALPDNSQTYRFHNSEGRRYILAVARLQLVSAINQGLHGYRVDSFTRVPKSTSNPMGTEEVFYRERMLPASNRGSSIGLPAGRVMLEAITSEEHQDAAIHLLRDPSISPGATVVGPTVQ
jgi:hypothetical protein